MTDGRLDIFDIVYYLATIGLAQANNPSHLATFNKCYVVEDASLWCECDHAQLAVLLEAVIDPNQRSFPIELVCQGKRNAMFRLVCYIFGLIELDLHYLPYLQ